MSKTYIIGWLDILGYAHYMLADNQFDKSKDEG